jgi:signal transduction histidine kinase
MTTSTSFFHREKLDPQPHARSLPRSMTMFETWGFGLSGHISWFVTNPLIVIALGPSSIFVLVPATILGVLLNLLVKQFGERWIDIAGGTPNYAAKLLHRYPAVGSYAAIGYWLAWVAALPINASILTDAIQSNLTPAGITCPRLLLKVGFIALPYILALSGSRALAILHLFFVIPAVSFSLLFCLQGLTWLGFSPDSPGLIADMSLQSLALPSFVDWAKWMFFALWLTMACETSTSFVADSQEPKRTLQFLPFAATLIPIVTIGTSWVLIRLANSVSSDAGVFEIVSTAAQPFWGRHASVLVTLLLCSACLLNSATSVSVSPRILYQLAHDRQLPAVFAFVSRRGVLTPNLIAALFVSLGLIGTDLSKTVIVTGVGWLSCMLTLLGGTYLRQIKLKTRRSHWLPVGMLMLAVVIGVGGWHWGKAELIIGLLAPATIVTGLSLIGRIRVAPFQLDWWLKRDQIQNSWFTKDFVAVQVVVLLVLVCSAATVSWFIKAMLHGAEGKLNNDLFIIVLMTVAFVAIALAAWTSLPQVAAIAEAREQAEIRFIAALETVPDAVLVVNETGIICQSNPAAQQLLNEGEQSLIDWPLGLFLPEFNQSPADWQERSEQPLQSSSTAIRTLEATVSQRAQRISTEYIVILRDISDRKLFEETLKQQATQLQKTLNDLTRTQAQLIQAEKMSSLGQLVAGIAHEINNPANFIHGNIVYVTQYMEDLIKLMECYQQQYPDPTPELQAEIEEIDLDFLLSDLPNVLASMKGGTDRIREIVLSLRSFSRLDEAESKAVDLHSGIESTLLVLQHRFKTKAGIPNIQVVKEYSLLPSVECYASLMNQVFMHLLTNAVDALLSRWNAATQPAPDIIPTIWIRTEVLKSKSVRICIKDNGLGIPESVKNQIFDPFFTTKSIGQGTGLGLSVSYQVIVDRHKGSLKCVSEVGQGAEFWIEIPIAITSANEKVKSQAA